MRHPFNRLMQIEIVTLGCACVFGFFALINGYYLLVIGSFYFVVVSLACEAIMKWQMAHTTEAGKQLVRAIILFLLTTYLLIRI